MCSDSQLRPLSTNKCMSYIAGFCPRGMCQSVKMDVIVVPMSGVVLKVK